MTFTNDNYSKSKIHQEVVAKTVIKKRVSIVANTTILAGTEIGENSLRFGGVVATKSLTPYSLCYGKPAVQQGFITKSNEILGIDLKSKSTRQGMIV